MPYTRRSPSEWTDHIRAYREGTESAEHYAQRNGLSISTFRAWIAKLKTSAPTPRFVPLVVRSGPTLKPRPPAHDAGAIVLEIGRVRLHVRPGFDPAHLADVVNALSRDSQ